MRKHTVERGEILWDLARANDTTVPLLMALNRLQPGAERRLPIGLELDLPPAGNKPAVAIAHADGTYSHWVGEEGGPAVIARMYGITPRELRDANPGFVFSRETWESGTVIKLPLLADVKDSILVVPERWLQEATR